jgi:hypothetical protein
MMAFPTYRMSCDELKSRESGGEASDRKQKGDLELCSKPRFVFITSIYTKGFTRSLLKMSEARRSTC